MLPSSSNPKNKLCPVCKKNLPLENFSKNASTPDGKYYRCKSCDKALSKKYYHLKKSNPKGQKMNAIVGQGGIGILPGHIKDEGQDQSLDLLLQIKRQRAGWTYQQVCFLMEGITEASKTGIIDFKKVFAKYGSQRSDQACEMMLKELRMAARAGMTLNDYWKKDRPFRAGAQVIVKGKNNAKNH